MKKRRKVSALIISMLLILLCVTIFIFMKIDKTPNQKQSETSAVKPEQQEDSSAVQSTDSWDADTSNEQVSEESIEDKDDKKENVQSQSGLDNEATIPENWSE